MKTRWRLASLMALLLCQCRPTPCATSRDCDGGQVCAAGTCAAAPCGQVLWLRDPEGACTPLSGCFLEEWQRGWPSCDAADPCAGQPEAACLADARCQPAYALAKAAGEPGSASCDTPSRGVLLVASVADQAEGLHPALTCGTRQERAYAGCRLVPQLPAHCSALDQESCAGRSDCQWGAASPRLGKAVQACQDRRPMRAPDCYPSGGSVTEREVSCLLNAQCQPTGTRCYCPPGADCPCSGGAFVACEHNDRFRRCADSSECAAGESCVKGPECAPARSGPVDPTSVSDPSPCLGVCAVAPCEGLGEAACHQRPECTEIYTTECSTGASSYYQECPLDPTGSALPGCLCDNVFQRCANLQPVGGLRPERSLLVRDPEIVSDPAFRIDAVLSSLARPGDEDAFIDRWLHEFVADRTLPSGAKAAGRSQFPAMLNRLSFNGGELRKSLAGVFHTTALINRIDLLGPGSCGEARIAFAYNGAYANTSDRMTVIVELRVPDDGQGCRQVAQQWAELSTIDDPAQRLARLQALYAPLVRPERLGQVRTNEFINSQRTDPWELREWHLADGSLKLAPARQAVAPTYSGSAELLAWVRGNLAAVRAGTAEVPERFLSAAVRADGKKVRLPGSLGDGALRGAEERMNREGCAGCHVGSTGTPFVHIGERLALSKEGAPAGRAVISAFLRESLPERARVLQGLLTGNQMVRALRQGERVQVH